MKKPPKEAGDEAPAMPFDEALKRVWSAKPMPHKAKPKTADKPAQKKPAK